MFPNLRLIHVQDPVFASQIFQSNDISQNEVCNPLLNINIEVRENFLSKLLYFTFHQFFIHTINVIPHWHDQCTMD
jgi:hypothetical protein